MDLPSLHLAPNAPVIVLLLVTAGFVALALWSYGFARPPLPPFARRALTALRLSALALVVWLLAMPSLDRARPAGERRVTVLVDRSASMERPVESAPGAATRAAQADAAVAALRRGFTGRARVEVREFASALMADSAGTGVTRAASAPGEALAALARLADRERPDAVVLVSDGAVNAGADPVAAAAALGVPVHTLLTGERAGIDRGIAGVEASTEARVGEATPVRVRVVSDEERGTPIAVTLSEDGRELARATVVAPGPGAEVVAELRPVPTRPGLASWTARVARLEGDASPLDDAHGVVVPVAPGRLGVLVLSSGLNWDLAALRRALLQDTTVTLETRVRGTAGAWRTLEGGATTAPTAADLRGRSVVVLDALGGAELAPALDEALLAFVREGGGLLLLAGPAPGAARFARGRLGAELAFAGGTPMGGQGAPTPTVTASELLAWDDEPARGERAWREAAPLADVAPLAAAAGDRVLIAARDGGAPLWLARAIGRGQALLVNGSGVWRWSLAGSDEFAAERGRRLWRRTVRWLAEPVQGDPLRVTPARRLVPGGESVRLDALLQDERWQPLAGAEVEATLTGPDGRGRTLRFAPGAAGAYSAEFTAPSAGRWSAAVVARRDGREAGRARAEFVVDRWTLEALHAQPDSAALAAVAAASGGRAGHARAAFDFARALDTRALARARGETTRLWESPWMFGAIVLLLSAEWVWRRRRGLP